MFRNEIQAAALTAAEARDRLTQLEAERALAVSTSVAEIPAYKHDLEMEIELWRRHYVTAAVTEIATLRAQLSGADRG